MDIHSAGSKLQDAGPSHTNSSLRGIVLLILGWMLSILGLTMSLGLFLYQGFGSGTFLWEPFVIFPSILAGGTVIHFGQLARLAGRRSRTRIASFPPGGEVFVLYLRVFDSDIKKGGLERPALRVDAMSPAAHLGALFFSGRSIEEHLITSLKSLGPVIAVGRPGERLSPAGAQRLYMPLDAWQEPVENLMSRARMVVIALDPHPRPEAGRPPGVVWEFLQVKRLVPPERLLLVIPSEKKEYDRFRAQAANELDRVRRDHDWTSAGPPPSMPELPEFRAQREASVPKERAIGGLVSYSSSWIPAFSPLVPLSLWDVLHVTLRRALRPALSQLLSFEQRLPQAQSPLLQMWKRRAERIDGMRWVFVAFVVNAVVYGVRRLGLPEGILEWCGIGAALLYSLTVVWAMGLLARRARLRAVPPVKVGLASYRSDGDAATRPRTS